MTYQALSMSGIFPNFQFLLFRLLCSSIYSIMNPSWTLTTWPILVNQSSPFSQSLRGCSILSLRGTWYNTNLFSSLGRKYGFSDIVNLCLFKNILPWIPGSFDIGNNNSRVEANSTIYQYKNFKNWIFQDTLSLVSFFLLIWIWSLKTIATPLLAPCTDLMASKWL